MIKGYVETLLGGAKDDPETAEKFLRVVERHADRLTLLIEDLLAIAQLESGQLQLHLGTIDLRAAAARGVEEFSVRAGARQVTLHNEIAAMEVLADPERLHQVLSNLIDNAIKYGRPGGNVWVSACAAAGGFVEVCVRDDGPGIQPSSVARVFERFYRADKARSREQGGTGLGLSIVKHLVLAQGGQVWVESEPGRGAAFRLTLRAPGAGASLAS